MRIARPANVAFYAVLAALLGGAVAVVAWQSDAVPPSAAWAGLAVFVGVLAFGLRKPWRRWRVAQQTLPASSRAWLDDHVLLYAHAAPKARARFERDVRFVLSEAKFEGVGVEVTDDLRLAVAAGVAMLLHGRPDWELPLGRTFLFYPGEFGDDYSELEPAYDGMVHGQGPVILTAPAVRRGFGRPENGSNVVLHELAHLFDYEDEFADGVPSLLDPGSVEPWTELVRRETAQIRSGRSMLRRYAAENSAEFFAVATEVFFERGTHLAERHPELFETMRALYNLDPRPPEDTRDEPEERASLMARRWR